MEEGTTWKGWKLIWRMKASQRVRVFCWIMAHGKLLTNEERWRRRLTSDANYGRCQSEVEDVLHAVRDCPCAREVWESLGMFGSQNAFFPMGLQDWVMSAFRLSTPREEALRWAGKFMTICWWQWRWRNAEVFEGERLEKMQRICMLVGNLEEVEQAYRLEGLQVSAHRLGPWV